MKIQIPALHSAQTRVKDEARRFNCVDCGRRWGKSLMGCELAMLPAIACEPVGWFAPSYKYLIEIWQELKRRLAPVLLRSDSQERRLELRGGGLIEMWTLEDQNAGRSRAYKRIIVDEAAMVPNLMDMWQANIRPTLMDRLGDAWFFSTPKGRNGFWQFWQNGQDAANAEWASWKMPTASNPYISPSEIEAARKSLPERIFAQEYLAEFLEDAGGVFRKVMAAATSTETPPIAGHAYVMGCDWAKLADFSVFTVIDINERRQVAMDRFNQVDYAIQTDRLKALAERYKPQVIMSETNSIGEPILERLQREGLPVRGFVTTNATKAQIIEGLALAFERGELAILNDPVLVGELQAYEMDRLPSGMTRYSAPEGMHDDTVMSLALAYSAAEVPSGASLVASW